MNSILPDCKSNSTHNGYRLTALLVAALLILTLTGLLYGRQALSAGPPAKVPLTVNTVVYEPGDSYQRRVSYLGLVVAGKRAQLAFEHPGQIATLPVHQGSIVSKGDVIATLDDAALRAGRDALAADLEQVRAELELAQLKSRRHQQLSGSGAVSKEAFDETRLRARALSSRVVAVTARLAELDIGLQKRQLIAPYDGIIADRYVHQGAVIGAGAPVVRLLQSGAVEAHVGVAAQHAAALIPGETYALHLRGTVIAARLLSVRGDVDPLTRSVNAVFDLPRSARGIDGEPVNLDIESTVTMAGGWLPVAALSEGKRGVWTVLVVVGNSPPLHTQREAVEVLAVQGDQAYVRGSLRPEAVVVANGVHRITPGTPVSQAQGR